MNRYDFSKNTFNKNRFIDDYIVWMDDFLINRFIAIDHAREQVLVEAKRHGDQYSVNIVPVSDEHRLGLRASFTRMP